MKEILARLQEKEVALSKDPDFSPTAPWLTIADAGKIAQKSFYWNKPALHVAAANNIDFEGYNDRSKVAFHSEMPQVPLLGQLLYHSQVIVRIRPWSDQDFARQFGITACQMAWLARQGWVVPALYDSDVKHYESKEHLRDLFDFEQTGAQIDYYRQQAFLPQGADNFGDEHHSLIRHRLENSPSRHLVNLTDNENIDSATRVLARHLSYLHAFSDLTEDADEYVKEMKKENLSIDMIFSLMFGIMTKSRSNVHQLSGAFGGSLEPDARYTKFWSKAHPFASGAINLL